MRQLPEAWTAVEEKEIKAKLTEMATQISRVSNPPYTIVKQQRRPADSKQFFRTKLPIYDICHPLRIRHTENAGVAIAEKKQP